MKRAMLEAMTDAELREYAALVGAKMDSETPRAKAVEAILHRANRTVDVEVAGIKLTVDVANLNDLRIAEVQAKETRTVADLETLAVALFGEEQEKTLRAYVTDEKGCVDGIAYAFVVGKAFEQAQSKN